MAFFDFVEKFFFISLAITFILIIMLVYHFKDRISLLEGKCETMFEIANNLVKEINFLRRVIVPSLHNPPSQVVQNVVYDQPVFEQPVFEKPGFEQPVFKKIVVSDSEYDSEDDVTESDDSDSESESEFDEFDEFDNENGHQQSIQGYKVSDEVLNDAIEIEVIEPELGKELGKEFGKELELDTTEPPIEDEDRIEISITEDVPEEIVSAPPSHTEENYKKMELSALKQLAIERAIATPSEVKKMKKQDLVKLLSTE
jgi:hypothetical protein